MLKSLVLVSLLVRVPIAAAHRNSLRSQIFRAKVKTKAEKREGRGRGEEKRTPPPPPLPSFFSAIPTLLTNSRGNIFYVG